MAGPVPGDTGLLKDQGQQVCTVTHGSTAGTARPTLGNNSPVAAAQVYWVGSVSPTHAIAGDVWWDTTNLLVKVHNGTGFDAAGSATYVAAVMPEAYGAAASYSAATDDTTALSSAISAAETLGSAQVVLSRAYKTPNGGLSASGKVTIRGVGGFDAACTPGSGSGFVQSSATAVCLTLNGDASTIVDFGIVNTAATPTTSVGYKIARGWWTQAQRVDVQGFYNNVEVVDACYYGISDSRCLDPVNYGIYQHNTVHGDFGEAYIKGNTIMPWATNRAGAAAFRWEAGGGVQYVQNEINGGAQPGQPAGGGSGYFIRGIDIRVLDGVDTGVFLINGNSINNCTDRLVHIGQAGPSYTGTLTNIEIVGNQLAFGPSGGPVWAIEIGESAGGSNAVQNVMISGNSIQSVQGGIRVINAQGVYIGPNQITPSTGGVSVQIDRFADFVDVAVQKGSYTSNHDVIVDNRNLAASAGAFHGHVDYDYDQAFSITALTTPVQVFKVTAQDGGGSGSWGSSMALDVTLVGGDKANGPFYAHYRRYVTVTATNTTTVTTVGTDEVTGQIAAAFNISGRDIAITVQVPAGSTPTCDGQAICKATGMVNKFHLGA